MLLSTERPIVLSDCEMQATGHRTDVEHSELQDAETKSPDDVSHQFCTFAKEGPLHGTNQG